MPPSPPPVPRQDPAIAGDIDRPRRAWLRRLLAAAGIVGMGWGGGRRSLAMSSDMTPAAPAPPPMMPLPASMLHQCKGLVQINGVTAERGAPVAPGDVISTGPDGEAVFVVGDDGFLLRPGSQVTIADRPSDQSPGGRMRELTLTSGRILSVFGPKQISLKTPLASVSIRGTAAYLESDTAAMNVCVCYGHAVMTPNGAPGLSEEVENHHHETPRIVFPGPHGPVMEAIRVQNHTDAELVMLESLFGRLPPFVPKPQ